MKQKLQESKNGTQNVLNPSRVNKLKSKLLIMSLSIFCLSINDNGFFQDLNANITDVLDTTDKKLYKKVLAVVHQKVCQNIELKAKDCGLDDEYWAKKAIDDKDDRFSNSIKNLEVLIAMSYVVDDVQYNEIVKKFKKAITNSLNKFGKLLNEGNLESGQDSQDTKLNSESEIDKCRNSVLGLINAWMVFETLFQHWWPCTEGTCAIIYDNPLNTSDYMGFNDIWYCSTRSPTKNRWRNKQYSPFQRKLLSTLESTNEDGMKLYKIISKPREDSNTGLFKHDFESWLEQFWVINQGTKRNLEIESSVLKKSYYALQQIEQPVGGDSNTINKNIPVDNKQKAVNNDDTTDTKIVLQDNKINNKDGDEGTIVNDSNVNNIEETTKKDKKENNVFQNSKAEAPQDGRIENVNPNVNPFAGSSSKVERNVIYQNGNGLNNQSNLRSKFLGNVDNPSNYQNNPNSNNVKANINSGNTSNNISVQQGALYRNNQTSNNQVDNRPGGQNNINNPIQNAFSSKINNSSQNSNNNLNNKFNMIPSYLNNPYVNYNNNNSNNKVNMMPNYRNNQNVNYNIGNGKYNIGNMNNNIKSYQNALNYRYNPNSGNMNANPNVVGINNCATNRVWMMPNNFNNFNLMPNLYSNYSNFLQFYNQYKNNKNTQSNLDLINIGKDVGTAGLNNIGATCFMNATLQCLLHIRPLTNYFLNNQNVVNGLLTKNNYRICANDDSNENRLGFEQDGVSKNKPSLLPYYMKLIENTVEPYVYGRNPGNQPYSAYGLRWQVEKLNPLFDSFNAGDAKDYVMFLLEQFDNELSQEIQKFPEPEAPENLYDSSSAWKHFCYGQLNKNSIIRDCFFRINKATSVCKNCERESVRKGEECPIAYNYDTGNMIIVPLEEVRKMFALKGNTVDLKNCFEYERKTELFTGENQMGCSICKKNADATRTTRILRAPTVLVLILNRGRGNEFNVKLDFTESLTLDPDDYKTDDNGTSWPVSKDIIEQNLNSKDGKWHYDLVGVVTHIGESGPYAHFVASCRISPAHKWFRYNDGGVSLIKDFKKEIHDYANPYILFYLLRE